MDRHDSTDAHLSDFIWCLHCERTYRRGQYRLVNGFEMCPYPDCDGTTVLDGWEITQSIIDWCYHHGLVILKTGTYGNCLRFLMPLIITDEELDKGLDILEEALKNHMD